MSVDAAAPTSASTPPQPPAPPQFPTLLGHSVFNWSMRYVSATVISVVILCEPIGASALAWLMFGTLPQASHYIGGAAVLAGVLVFMRYRNPPAPASASG